MSAVPVAVRRIRRRALAKEIESGSRSAAAEARAVRALMRVVDDQVGPDFLKHQVGQP